MRERNDVLGWANNDKRSWRRGTFKKIKRLWALVQERTPQKPTRTPETPTGAIFGLDTPE
jgi:hypothetical protein